MIKALIGDLLESPMQVKVNTVNCVGIMGKGIALIFKQQYPDMFEDYQQRVNAKEIRPGEPYLYTNIFGEKILNFPTKDHWKSLSRIEYVTKGLDIFRQKYKEWGIESIAFPPLGCGNGGLEWRDVGPLMYQKLRDLDIDVEIYAPHGTPKEQLKDEFLMSSGATKGKASAPETNIKAGWVAILEILNRLENMPYVSYVGRVIFQKICYVATRAGLDTGLEFRRGSYGPYSSQVAGMERTLSNANLIQESMIGQMVRVHTGKEYPGFREKHRQRIDAVNDKIDRVVDLFSRIKSTSQAEEVATVLFAIDEIRSDAVQEMTNEEDFYKYLVDWKKRWNNPSNRESLAGTIRFLAQTGWAKIDFSDDLPVAETEKLDTMF